MLLNQANGFPFWEMLPFASIICISLLYLVLSNDYKSHKGQQTLEWNTWMSLPFIFLLRKTECLLKNLIKYEIPGFNIEYPNTASGCGLKELFATGPLELFYRI